MAGSSLRRDDSDPGHAADGLSTPHIWFNVFVILGVVAPSFYQKFGTNLALFAQFYQICAIMSVL